MKYERILRAFAQTPFALMPEKAREIIAFLELKSTGAMLSPDDVARRIGRAPGARSLEPLVMMFDIETGAFRAFDQEQEMEQRAQKPDASTAKGAGNVAVVNVFGVINQRASGDMSTESASTEKVGQAMRSALAAPDTKALVLNVDSPGGSVYGVAELGAEIMRLRGSKPIIAQANSLMASAAYWIGSACDELVCTPSGEVGSIGVYGVHQDWSKAYEDLGVSFTMIKAGKFKAEGVDFAPLGDEASAYMQKRVDEYYTQFVRAVAKGRGVSESEVRNGFGEGRVVGAAEAVKLKMADRIDTLSGTLSRLGVKGSPTGARASVSGAAVGEQGPQLLRSRTYRLGELVGKHGVFQADMGEGDGSMMTDYEVGDRVRIKAGKEHDAATKGKAGVITEIGTEALGIQFDGTTETHKWYVDDEVEPDDGEAPAAMAAAAFDADMDYRQNRNRARQRRI